MHTGTPQIGDLYRCTPGGPPQLNVAAPLLLDYGEAAAPVGTLLLALDVPKVLTPILGRWPVPSTSGEIILAERQGDSAVDLSGFVTPGSPAAGSLGLIVRYPITAPLTATDLPLVRAVLQPEGSAGGSAEGINAHGTPVLAGLSAVGGTPWRLAAQRSLVEIDEPLATRFGWYAAAAAGLVGLSVALVALLLQAYRQRTLRSLYEQVRGELATSEQEYHTLFDASPTPLSLSQPDEGRFVDVNQAFLDQFGYSRTELIGRTSVEVGLFSAGTRAGAVSTLYGTKINATEISIHCKNGEIRERLAAADLLDLPHGQFLLISTMDVTAHKQAEDALRLGEARLLAIIENTRNTIWSVDRDYRLVVANAAFGRMTAASSAAHWPRANRCCTRRYPPAVNAFWQAQYDRALRGESFVVELDFSATSGTTRMPHEPHSRARRQRRRRRRAHHRHHQAKAGAAAPPGYQRRTRTPRGRPHRRAAGNHRRAPPRQRRQGRLHGHREPRTAHPPHRHPGAERGAPKPGPRPPHPAPGSPGGDDPRQRPRLLDTVNSVLLYTSLAGGKYPLQAADCLLTGICAEAILALRAKADAKGQHVDLAVVPTDLAICSDASAIARILHILLDNAVKFTPQGGTVGIQACLDPAAETGSGDAQARPLAPSPSPSGTPASASPSSSRAASSTPSPRSTRP